MDDSQGKHLSVAKALYQLDFYLKTLALPITVQDLYERAYRDRRGSQYDDRWLQTLPDSPEVAGALEEPFTTHTIVETLMRTGHEPIVRALMREVRRQHIGFTHAYMIGSHRRG